MKDDKLFLIHILERIKFIEDYTQSGHETFMQSQMIQDAVMRNFEIIGEAVRNLSEELRQTYPDVEWQQISGFRNILIHAYWSVDNERVWGIIQNNLPTFKDRVEEILKTLSAVKDEE
ncbi:MAG: DUF86 domain-containing protein [Chloroflexi bacterium]|nr:DUF86 domain-containing protein [Chloroflexota bacterium]